MPVDVSVNLMFIFLAAQFALGGYLYYPMQGNDDMNHALVQQFRLRNFPSFNFPHNNDTQRSSLFRAKFCFLAQPPALQQ